MDKIEELLTRGVSNIIPNKETLEKALNSDKKLNIYLGIDPTSTQIHLGHTVPLRKLNAFAELGHNVTFLIGDFTALIGDTSDKDKERPALTRSQIEENFKTYKSQAEKVINFSKVKVRYNSEWLSKLSYEETIKLMQQYSLNDFISRELIRKRLDQGRRVALHEAQYPVMQGYDSYFLDIDLQIGGTDQTFNMQAGRTLIKNWRNKESYILATEFLMGTDGRKMSKTWGNAIWVEDFPDDMYAKVMAIKDDLIVQYYLLATTTPMEKTEKIKKDLESGENPMRIKKDLARQIVNDIWGENAASKASENFEKRVQQKELPEDIQVYPYTGDEINISDLITKMNMAESKSEAKRLIEQGGVSIDNEVLKDPNAIVEPKNNQILKVGKRKFVRIKT